MLKNRYDLEEFIYAIKEDYYRKRQINKLQEKAIKELKQYIPINKIIGILNNRIPLQQLSEQELFYVSYFMYDITNNEDINIKKWFTDSEIGLWINSKIAISNRNIVEIDNVMFNGSELNPEYLCYIPYRKLAVMMEQGQIEYDTSLQRSPKIITKLGKIIEVPTVNQNSVMEIKEKMLNGEFFSNQITFNMLNEGIVFWNYYNGKLSIDTTKGRLLIIDGYHRLSALLKAYRENENIDGVLHLNIKTLDADGCKNFIWQESLANKHDEDTIDRFNINSKVTMFINKINSYRNKEYNPFNREIETAITKGGCIKEDVFRLILIESKFIDIINDNDTNITELTDYVCRLFSCVINSLNNKTLMSNYCFILGMMFIAKQLFYETDFDEVVLSNKIVNHKAKIESLNLQLTKKSISNIKKTYLNMLKGDVCVECKEI